MVAVSEQMGRMQCILETDRNKILIKNLRTFALLVRKAQQLDEDLQHVRDVEKLAKPWWG